jgi:Na+-translocating ferredoxin:NAD+ oxidoreductase RnfG subunit
MKTIQKTIVWLAVIISLTIAYIYGVSRKDTQVLTQLQSIFPEKVEFQTIGKNPLLLEVHDKKTENFLGYSAVEKSQGWGGPLQVATIIDPEGTINRIAILDHKETPSFFLKLQRHNFFSQFSGEKNTEPFVLGEDIDTITQATVTSKAVTDAVRTASHGVGRNVFGLDIPKEQKRWDFGIDELMLLLLYIGVMINQKLKSKTLRLAIMAAAFAFLGFYLNSAIAIGNISQILLGFVPSIRENIFWWILIGGALLMPLVLRKNLYCSYLCPFGTLQDYTAKLSGFNIVMGKKFEKLAKIFPLFLTWFALVIIFITSNPALGTYEPFATFFRLEGEGIQWYILPAVVLGSFLLTRFFCRFFCPVGVVLNLLVKSRNSLENMLKREKK